MVVPKMPLALTLACSHYLDVEVQGGQQIAAKRTYVLSVYLRTLYSGKDPHGHLEAMHKFVPQGFAGCFPLVVSVVP
jgi:hypothetical protein